MSKFFRLLLEKSSNEKDIQEMAIKLLLLIYEDQCFKDHFKLNIPDTIRIELMMIEPPNKAIVDQLFRGILVPCTSQIYFDVLAGTKNKERKFRTVLVNRVVYGDSFGDSDKIKIRQVLTWIDFNEEDKEPSYHNLCKFNIELIICYGELPPSLVIFCLQSNIFILPVSDYEILFQIRQMLNKGSIVFDVDNDLRETDMTEVSLKCHTQQLQHQPRINKYKKVKRDLQVCGFIQILPFRNDFEDCFYTVLLYGRGHDLAVLKQEAFLDTLNRVKYLLKAECFTSKSVEAELIQKLSTCSKEDCLTTLECTPWVSEDVKLFFDTICEHLLETLQTFQRLQYELDTFEVLHFKERLWKDSLEFVCKILSIQDVKAFSL